jgi:hypothetical protein
MRPFVGAIIGGALFGFASGDGGAAIIGAVAGGLITKATRATPQAADSTSSPADWRTGLDEHDPELGAFLADAVRDGVIPLEVAARLAEYRLRDATTAGAAATPAAGEGGAPPGEPRRVKTAATTPAWVGDRPPLADAPFATVFTPGFEVDLVGASGRFSRVRTDSGKLWWVVTDRLRTVTEPPPVASVPAPYSPASVVRAPAQRSRVATRPAAKAEPPPVPVPAEPSALAVGMGDSQGGHRCGRPSAPTLRSTR